MKNVIYQIVNLVTGIRYIGSAVDFDVRKKEHKRKLKSNVHKNKHLQHSYNKHGKEVFIFEILDHVPYAEELVWREQYWMDKYDFDSELYNLRPTADSMLGFRHSKETIELLTEMFSGENHPFYGRTVPQETRDKISESLSGKNNPNYGKPRSKQTRDRIAKANKGKKRSEKTRERIAKSKIGTTLTEEHKENISKALLAKGQNRKPVYQLDKDTEEILNMFDSITLAVEHVGGKSTSRVAQCCKGKVKTSYGYKWKYV